VSRTGHLKGICSPTRGPDALAPVLRLPPSTAGRSGRACLAHRVGRDCRAPARASGAIARQLRRPSALLPTCFPSRFSGKQIRRKSLIFLAHADPAPQSAHVGRPGAGLEPPFRAGALRPAWLRPIERAEGTLSDGAARPRRARSDRCIGHRQNELVRIVDGAAWSDSGSAPMPRAASTSLYCRTPHRISPTKRCGRAGSRPCATKAWRQSSMPIWSAGSPKNSVTAIRKRSRA